MAKVRMFNLDALKELAKKNAYTLKEIEDTFLVSSFKEYKKLGGERTYLDLYAKMKERGKQYESKYISFLDMQFSGIPVDEDEVELCMLTAQVNYLFLNKIFGAPLRIVSYSGFTLEEFNAF